MQGQPSISHARPTANISRKASCQRLTQGQLPISHARPVNSPRKASWRSACGKPNHLNHQTRQCRVPQCIVPVPFLLWASSWPCACYQPNGGWLVLCSGRVHLPCKPILPLPPHKRESLKLPELPRGKHKQRMWMCCFQAFVPLALAKTQGWCKPELGCGCCCLLSSHLALAKQAIYPDR